jgi:hypothetical protein
MKGSTDSLLFGRRTHAQFHHCCQKSGFQLVTLWSKGKKAADNSLPFHILAPKQPISKSLISERRFSFQREGILRTEKRPRTLITGSVIVPARESLRPLDDETFAYHL